MNQDGIPDLVHGPARKSLARPVVFLGDGKGGFKRWAEANFPTLPYDYGSVVVADFNGDGHAIDIGLSCHLRGLTVLIGDGKGDFTEWGRGLELRIAGPNEGIPFSAGALAAVDWNGDGRVDLAALPEGASRVALRAARAVSTSGIQLFLNEPEAWRMVALPSSNSFVVGTSLAVGDVNGDGREDLLAGSSTLGLTKILHLNETGGVATEPAPELPVPKRAFVTAVALADFDKNGRDDPVVAFSVLEGTTRNHRVEVHLSFPDRFQTATVTQDAEKSAFRAIAVGDLDGDGNTDLTMLQDDGTLKLYRGGSDGRFTLVLSEPPPAWRQGCAGYDIHLVDLDGDKRPEIVASFAGEPNLFSLQPMSASGGGIQAWKLTRHDGQ